LRKRIKFISLVDAILLNNTAPLYCAYRRVTYYRCQNAEESMVGYCNWLYWSSFSSSSWASIIPVNFFYWPCFGCSSGYRDCANMGTQQDQHYHTNVLLLFLDRHSCFRRICTFSVAYASRLENLVVIRRYRYFWHALSSMRPLD